MALLNNTPQEYYDEEDFGNYQFVSLKDIINQFMMVYVGEDKIIPKAKRLDVAFHAQRALAELSFDTFKSYKSQEFLVPGSLQMILPQDYVNYTKISWVDSAGLKHLMYPTSRTSNPSSNPLQDSDGLFKLQAIGNVSDSSGVITLDGEYKDILVGMSISGPYIDLGLQVIQVTNAGGVTTITVGTIVSTTVGTTYTAVIPDESFNGATLTFTSNDGSLILPQKESYIVEDLDWTGTDFKVNFNALADMDNIKIGMLIYHEDFPVGTFVEDISTTDLSLKVSQEADNPVLTNLGEITFISPDPVDTEAWSSYKSANLNQPNHHTHHDHDHNHDHMLNGRYGLDPQYAQVNGSFYIDEVSGKIHFSSNISGKTVILDYISDSLGTDAEMQVHKFAEEAMYKCIAHAILSGKANIPEYQVNRFKKERFAAIRTAKLRLSNLKIEELTQILRGKSKWIKH